VQQNFTPSLSVTLAYEGGWADHPKDPGGATMKGVTLATFRRFYPKATKADLKAISDADIARIYRQDYWQPVKGDTLAAGVDLATFDAAVNSGPARARKWLLASVGGAAPDTVKKLCAKRLGFMRSLAIWSTFGKGWSRRVAAIEAKGVAWALAATGDKTVVKEVLRDEQAKAESTASKQTGGAATAGGGATVGGGDVVANPEHLDAISGWVIGGVLGVAALLVAILVIRAVINRHRAEAYRAEAARSI
jgi:lysozyme family protein